MKIPTLKLPDYPIRKNRAKSYQSGFALVVTLTLMILLTIIAVGLLTLSTIALRSSSQGDAKAVAQANARLALMLALGDLQKYAGPDQSVTARADITSETVANPRLTGVWESRNFDAASPPTPADYEQAARDAKFKGWLASSTIGTGVDATQIGFANSNFGTDAKTSVSLWDKGTLGNNPVDAKNIKNFVRAVKVPAGKGAFAYAVMDEGVKVRINTPYDNSETSLGMKSAQLGSGERPNTASIAGLDPLQQKTFEYDSPGFDTIRKGITRLNMELAADEVSAGVSAALKPLSHDVTMSSTGLLTDTAKGGLKEDFSLLTQASTLPAPYAGTGVYQSLLGLPAVSDPRWESLQKFAGLFKEVKNVSGSPLIKTQSPPGWTAGTAVSATTDASANLEPPPGVVLMPTIARVQLLFSLAGRDLFMNLPPAPIKRPLKRTTEKIDANGIHWPQDDWFTPTPYDYHLHLTYTPIVTLHNPYNVTIEVTNMELAFSDVPFAMRVYRSNQAQSTAMVPLDTMYIDNKEGLKPKTFGMKLYDKNSSNAPGIPRIRLLPGEVKMFSAYLDPTFNYINRWGNFWDIELGNGHNLTADFKAIPGWRGDGIAFDCDWLAGGAIVNQIALNGHWGGCVAMKWNDEIYVEFAPIVREKATKFVITAKASTSTGNKIVSAIEMDLENSEAIKDSMVANGAEMPIRYPKTGTIQAWELIDRAETPISELRNVKPFALLSVQAKNTSGARDTSIEDGRYATKPWSFAHGVIGASTQKVAVAGNEHPASHSHEFDLQRLDSDTSSLFQLDAKDRSPFITGNTGYGIKFGTMYDVPLAPVQTLSSLNGANPGGSSGYLPRFAQPIGNSWAHPLVDPKEFSTSGGAYPYLDHSFLLNTALYDHFYFSGLADQSSGTYTSGKSTGSLVSDFIAGKPLMDPRLALHTPDGKPADELVSEVNDPLAHTKIAAWQLMNGAFNINSTSVPAWKAMLGSIQDTSAIFAKIDRSAGSVSTADLPATDTTKNETRISRFRFPSSESAADGADPVDAYWLGLREYSDSDLETLATKIVEQVRKRGPFLSLSEFVNRQLGSDEKAQRGALQQAIDESNLNDSQPDAGPDISEETVSTYKYANPEAGTGDRFQGAPGYLSQADILSVLGNAATPRSDTFTIRGYGESRDAGGNIQASATCEAVVQRVPEFIDSSEPAATQPAALTREANKKFGRRFEIVSFRWLAQSEI